MRSFFILFLWSSNCELTHLQKQAMNPKKSNVKGIKCCLQHHISFRLLLSELHDMKLFISVFQLRLLVPARQTVVLWMVHLFLVENFWSFPNLFWINSQKLEPKPTFLNFRSIWTCKSKVSTKKNRRIENSESAGTQLFSLWRVSEKILKMANEAHGCATNVNFISLTVNCFVSVGMTFNLWKGCLYTTRVIKHKLFE